MNMQLYKRTARFDQEGRALTEDELRTMAPSIFATDAHASRSDRFAPIPTIEVVRKLAKEGFSVVGAQQARSRVENIEHTKHLLRLRRLDEAKKYQVGDTVFEALLKNANDGSSIWDLMAGLFRIQCLNSLVAATAISEAISVRHSGDAMGKVIEGVYRVIESSAAALEAPDKWSRIQLDDETRGGFARVAHAMRFADATGEVTTLVKPEQMLIPRRPADTGRDLWTTFNVVQENAVRGGVHASGTDAAGRFRRRTTRTVNGIDQSTKLNAKLWTLASETAERVAA
jgi:hypothetical protein